MASVGENGSEPAISGQSHRLVYRVSNVDWNIWRTRISGVGGANSSEVLIGSTLTDVNAQYSPDGKHIVFVSDRSGDFEIYLCDADGANPVQLTTLGAYSGTPRWFPDSQQIVFDSNKEGQFEIYVTDISGRAPSRLTTNPTDDAAPSVSWNGRWIYFSSMRTGRYEVWRMPAEGGEPVQITRQGGFSPFESWVQKTLYYQKIIGNAEVWKVSVEGGEEVWVTGLVHQRQFAVVKQGIYLIQPREEGGRPLRFLDFATGGIREVAKIDRPTWLGLSVSPDGRFVLYTQLNQTGSDLMLVENFQ